MVIFFIFVENSDYKIIVWLDKCIIEKCDFGMVLFVFKSVNIDIVFELLEELYIFKFC